MGNTNKPENCEEHISYADSKARSKERFPGCNRDLSKVSGARDSSKGSGYEPVGWGNDNLTNSNLKNSTGSKIYEDLDEVIQPITSNDFLLSSTPQDKLESLSTQNEEQQTEDIGREQKQENDKHEEPITRGKEDQYPLNDKMTDKMREQDPQTETIMLKEAKKVEDNKNKRGTENTEKEKIEKEDKERKRLAKEEKEMNERV